MDAILNTSYDMDSKLQESLEKLDASLENEQD